MMEFSRAKRPAIVCQLLICLSYCAIALRAAHDTPRNFVHSNVHEFGTVEMALQHAATATGGSTWADDFLLDYENAQRTPTSKPMQAVIDCMKKASSPETVTTWDTSMADIMPSIRIAATWYAAESKDMTNPVTAATSCGLERLGQVAAQCRSWPGRSSIVLWQPLIQSDPINISADNKRILQVAIIHVSRMLVELSQVPRSCRPDVMLIYEILDDVRTTTLYPINLLRNIARLQVRTPLVAQVDADMVISHALADKVENTTVAAQMMQAASGKTVYVIPAFESYGPVHEAAAWSDALVTQPKDVLRMMVKRHVVDQFDVKRHHNGHAPTDYLRWFNATTDYEIKHGNKYEPWILGDAVTLPWYDARYRGYSWDRIASTQHLNCLGYKFTVLHESFIIHRAHPPSRSRHEWQQQFQVRIESGLIEPKTVFGHPQRMYEHDLPFMRDGSYEPVLSRSTIQCIQSLPWFAKLAASATFTDTSFTMGATADSASSATAAATASASWSSSGTASTTTTASASSSWTTTLSSATTTTSSSASLSSAEQAASTARRLKAGRR